MTLYSREEIIGKNCRFLQGKYTSKAATAKIRNAIETGREVDVQLLNYRKDGTPFWNNFLLLPVHRKKGSKKVTHFIAIQKVIRASFFFFFFWGRGGLSFLDFYRSVFREEISLKFTAGRDYLETRTEGSCEMGT